MVTELTSQERELATLMAARTQHQDEEGRALVDQVARIFGTSAYVIYGPSRVARLVDARSVIAVILRERCWTQDQIGNLLNRNHSTVTNLQQRIDKDHDLKQLARELAA